MIDKDRRKKLAYHLRHLSIGLITNDEFEDYITDDVTFGWLPEQYYRAKEAKLDDAIIRPMLELSWCLYSDLKCDRIKTTDVGKLLYTKNSLIDFFILYNNCNGTTSISDNSKIVNYESKKEKKDLFNLNIKTRINNVTMAVQNEMNDFRDTDFGKKTNFGIGVEAEFILPVNKNKWALFLEPTFQSFNTEVTNEKTALYGFGVLTAKSEYNSVELPIGIRHYFFLSPNSKIFLNAAFVYDLSFGSSIKFIKTDGSNQDSLEISNGNNFAFGLGYKLYDKFSLEFRYNSNRDFLSKYSAWSSDYKSFSIILGYTLF